MAERRCEYTFEKEGMQGLCNALKDEDPRLRQIGAMFLGKTKDERIIGNLIEALHDGDKQVRARAVEGLVNIGDPTVELLLGSFNDSDWVVRYRVAEALGLIRDPRAIVPLIDALSDEKDHVRYMSAKSLGYFADERAVNRLIELLQDENEFVRRSAATALGGTGGEGVCSALEKAADAENCTNVEEAMRAAIENASRKK